MVLESLLASILTRYLGSYVKNLNTDQLEISLFRGVIELENLEIRSDALDFLKLPVTVKSGKIGKVSLTIPLSQLKTKPVEMKLDNLYLLAGPKSSVKWDEKEHKESLLNMKLKHLTSLEAIQQEASAMNDVNNSGYFSSLLEVVLENIQVMVLFAPL